MSPATPFLRINGRTGLEPRRIGWPTAAALRVVAVSNGPLELAALPDGVLGLASPSGDLGGLALPPWLAVDADGRTLLLDRRGRLLRLGLADRAFRRVPGLGGDGVRVIACTHRSLAIADRDAGRVLVYDAQSFGLRAVLDARAVGEPFRPASLYADGNDLLILDTAGRRVLGLHDGREAPRLLLALPAGAPAVDRVLRTRDGRIVVKVADAPRLLVFAADGMGEGEIDQAAALRSTMVPPPVRFDNHGRFRPHGSRGPAFDRDGHVVEVRPDEPAGPPSLACTGAWVSRALDGRRDDARWHRLTVRLASFPPGTSLRVRTLTANEDSIDGRDPASLDADAWDLAFTAAAPLQPLRASEGRVQEGWVQSEPGRHLWLRVELAGAGRTTPSVLRMDVAYDGPAAGDLLPAVFKEDRAAWRFLQRFLGVTEDELGLIETRIEERGHIVDPRLASPEQLELMAERLGLVLEENWDEAAKRRLLEAARGLLTRRGTPAAVQAQLAAVLAALSGREVASLMGFPRLLEGYAERRWIRLGTNSAGLDQAAPIWCRAMSGRVRLGEPVREGEAQVAGPGDESTDDVRAHAHRFRVFVPATFLPNQAAIDAFQRAVGREKPAHTKHELHRVRPGFVVGRQATLGLDTILGDLRPLRLGGGDAAAPAGARLGIDATLVAGEPGPGVVLRPGLRIDRNGLRI
jgi:phage tail-like protein